MADSAPSPASAAPAPLQPATPTTLAPDTRSQPLAAHEPPVHSNRSSRLMKLSLAALGVVFGDIGTSPLYAMRECFHGPHAVAPTPANVLGVLSLIFWAITLIVSVKYVAYVLRADNQGEGGILALMTLVSSALKHSRLRAMVIVLGVFGATLLCGEGVITPAISVLSAVEGLKIATPRFTPLVIPVTVAILIALFAIQRHGTERVGGIFGPVMVVWFTVLAALGLHSLVQTPEVLGAFMPTHAISFLIENGFVGFAVLGAVVLVITGSEALYADLGHFGRAPIRRAWFLVAFPGLSLNYLGQGALMIRDPKAAENPFYNLMPEWALYPGVVLATAGRGDRLAGLDFRGLLDHAPGHDARLLAAPEHQAHLRRRARPDLRAHHQLDHDAGHARAGVRLQDLDQLGRCVRHRRHADDGYQHRAAVLPGHALLGLERAARPFDRLVLLHPGARIPDGDHAEDPPWRLVSAGGRRLSVRADAHLEARS